MFLCAMLFVASPRCFPGCHLAASNPCRLFRDWQSICLCFHRTQLHQFCSYKIISNINDFAIRRGYPTLPYMAISGNILWIHPTLNPLYLLLAPAKPYLYGRLNPPNYRWIEHFWIAPTFTPSFNILTLNQPHLPFHPSPLPINPNPSHNNYHHLPPQPLHTLTLPIHPLHSLPHTPLLPSPFLSHQQPPLTSLPFSFFSPTSFLNPPFFNYFPPT